MTARQLITLSFLVPTLLFGQNREELTATQIVDSSLIFCGGELRISKIESSKMNYLLIQPDQKTAIINEQLKTGKKYVQSILSKTHVPQTTFYDGEKISRVNGSSITYVTGLQSKEEVKLKTYNQIQYGCKKLGYQLSRLPDQKFKKHAVRDVSAAHLIKREKLLKVRKFLCTCLNMRMGRLSLFMLILFIRRDTM